MRARTSSSEPVTSMTTVWLYGQVESTGSHPASCDATAMRTKTAFLSSARKKRRSASTASASSSAVGALAQTGPCVLRR